MRFASIIIAGTLAVLAHAQSSSTTTKASSTTSVVPTLSADQARIQACLEACKPDDVNCKANCITVPSPSHAQANQTTECVAKCPQGSGSPADTEAYRACVDGCIAQYYYTSTGAPAGVTTAGGATGTGSASGASATGSGTGGGSPSSTSGSAQASGSSGSDASVIRIGSFAIGLVAFTAALFSL